LYGDLLSHQGNPPKWMQRNTELTDNDYFENMTRIIFQGGLNWKVIENKWPYFQKVFRNFSVNQVAEFDDSVVEQLMEDKGIVRNRSKIIGTILNAKEFQLIKKEFGTFKKYIDSLDKSNNYSNVINVLSKRFSRMGPSSAKIFLYSVGENIKHEM
jgi:3-methyladenine DNA glycosylase Tag